MSEHQSGNAGRPDSIRIILVVTALALSIVGQILLHSTPIDDTVVIPTAVWVSVAAVLVFMLVQLYRPLPIFQKNTPSLANKGGLLWIAFAVFLSVLAAIASILFERYSLNNYVPVVSIWLMGALCYLLAFAPEKIPNFEWKEWFSSHRKELLILGAIFLLATILRFHNLGEYPRVIDGDEGRIGMYVLATGSGRLSNPFALWENIGAFYLQAINVVVSIFGPAPYSLRLLPAIAGTLAVVSTYLLARQVAGKRVALIAAFLLAISHTHIHFSRTSAVSYIQGTWLIPLEMYFFLSGLEKRSAWRAALAGVLLAIHMNIYLSAQIMLGVFAVYTLVAFILLKDSIRPAWRQALAFWGGFLITNIPGASYMLRHPAEFLSRMNAEGTFNSGWLANEILFTGKSTAQILAERVIHAFLSLIYYPALDFYGSLTPMLSLISGSLFLLGLAYALVKTRSPKFLLLNGYFWGATVAIGIFAIPPSADSYRMLVALPPALIMAAIALEEALDKLGISWQQKPYRHAFLVSIVLFSLLVFNIYTYYFDFLGQCRFGGDRQTRFASYLGNYVRGIQSESDIYLLSDNIFRYGSHDSVNFLTKSRPIINFPDPINTLSLVSGETIIASPPRIEELRAWARENPGGKLHYEYDCDNPILLSYEMP
jgi:hypothetical protein